MSLNNHEKALLERRSVVVSLLASIRRAFSDNREDVDEFASAYSDVFQSSTRRHPGLVRRINDFGAAVFTSRGVDRAKAMFHRFDASREGKMSFADFRGYLATFGWRGELDAAVSNSRESWQSFMHDLCETTEDGKLTAHGFVLYRALIERRFSLADDLLKLGMGVLDTQLRQWVRNKRAFRRLVREATGGSEEDLRLEKRDFQFLLYECGEPATMEMVQMMLEGHYRFNAVIQQVRDYHVSRNEFAFHQPSTVDGTDTDLVYYHAFLAWFMSARPCAQHTGWHRQILVAKNAFKRAARNTVTFGRRMLGHISSAVDKGALNNAILDDLGSEEARLEMSMEIGSIDDDAINVGVAWGAVENVAEAFSSIQAPRGALAAITLDFLVRSTAQSGTVSSAVSCIEQMVEEHFQTELLRLPAFHSWRVSHCHNEVDLVPVIRVAMFFKEEACVDRSLRALGLGFPVTSVIKDVDLECQFSLSLTDIFDTQRTLMKEQFGCRATGNIAVARAVLAKVMEEILVDQEDAVAVHNFEAAEREAAQALADGRTVEATRRRNPKEPPLPPPSPDDETTTEEWHKTDEQRQAESEARWRCKAWSAIQTLRGSKAMTVECRFANIEEFLVGNKYVKQWFTHRFARKLENMLSKPGECTRWFRRTFNRRADDSAAQLLGSDNSVEAQIDVFRDTVAQFEDIAARERAIQDAETEAAEARLTAKERAHKRLMEEKRKMRDKLLSLGAGAAGGADGADDASLTKWMGKDDDHEEEKIPETTQEVLKRVKAEQIASVKAFLDMYDTCWPALLGLQSVKVQNGAARLYVSFQGLDFVELLPEPLREGESEDDSDEVEEDEDDDY